MFQNRLFAAWKGAGVTGPALAVFFQNRLFAAWKGAGVDERMFWSSTADGNNWTPQQVGIGGGSTTGPALAVFQNRLFAAWKGAGRDERMFFSFYGTSERRGLLASPGLDGQPVKGVQLLSR